jgi:hypothetical protein
VTSETTIENRNTGASRRVSFKRGIVPGSSAATMGMPQYDSVQNSVALSGNSNDAGITPVTVYARPSSDTLRPTMPGSRPK